MTTNRLVSTTLGVATICLLYLSSAMAKPRPPQPPWPQSTIKIFGFDSPYWNVPWRAVAINEEESTLVESWSGYALERSGLFLSPIVIPVRVWEKEMNLDPVRGSVRFWLAPNWSTASEKSGGKGPGHLAHLLALVDLNGKTSEARWALFLNETGDTLHFVGQTKLGLTELLKAPVAFVAGDWRMITLCYSETNTVLLLDNEVIAKGEGAVAPAPWAEKDLFLVVGSDVLASPDSLAEAQFEELTTTRQWPRPSDWQALYFTGTKQRTLLGALGTKEEEQTKVAGLKAAGLLPEDYGLAKSGGEGDGPIVAYSYAEGSLWLEITGVTNGLASLNVHGTTENVAYEILSKENLTNSEWAGEQVILGAVGQDWTPTTVTVGTRTNNLFFWARTLVDADGDGLPDWWELAHALDPNNPDTGNTGVSDGYKDSDNDGWNNLEEYQNGTSPGSFNTPPPPRAVIARFDSTGTNVILTWASGGGPVVNYSVQYGGGFPIVTGLSSGTFTATVDVEPGFLGWIPSYRIEAEFSDGSFAVSEVASLGLTDINAALVRGSNGNVQLVLQTPPNLARIRMIMEASWLPDNPWFEIEATNMNGGVVTLTSNQVQQALGYGQIYVQAIYQDGTFSGALGLGWLWMAPEEWEYDPQRREVFVDARQHLKENLRFLLRSATVTRPFSYTSGFDTDPAAGPYTPDESFLDYPESYFARHASPTNYEYAGFHYYSPYQDYAVMTPTRPVKENYLWRNFAYHAADFSSSRAWTNGVDYNAVLALRILEGNANYRHTTTISNSTPVALAFDSANAAWLFGAELHSSYANYYEKAAELGMFFYGNDTNNAPISYLGSNVRNNFGLPLNSLRADSSYLYSPGAVFDPQMASLYFPSFEQPVLQTVDYYFNSQTPAFAYGATLPPLPGTPDFSVTNTTPTLLASVGKLYSVAGWAKQGILNGYANKFGFLEQYFDKAYKTTNGVVTTNETGILSPYGEFFPTEPGLTALVTMPDLDTDERGTAMVHVVSMNLDVNHDGNMDRTFAGPDNTSQSKPFTFWCNNDYDVSSGTADLAGHEGNPQYRINSSDPGITCQRDLEDFARLWICGMPALTNGYQVTLSMNALSGNPAINLVNAVETNGGTLYLTDSNTAYAQVYDPYGTGPGQKRPTISATNALTLSSSLFTNSGNKYFLFEGRGIGSGELVLTIWQGSNVLAQTSTWLDIHDVKDFYEQGLATNVTSGKPPSSLVSDFSVIKTASAAPDETKQVIIFVHGINNTVSDYESTTRTIFKRLYWAGYHGRFASFRWPCAYLPPSTANPFQYNLGEFYAFKSATALKNYLSYLRNRQDLAGYAIDLYAHSQGNVVASEAVAQGATFDNYILTQGAIPAHCYDTNAPFLQKLLDAETNSVNATQTPFYPVNGGYHGYFAGLQGNLVDFYNTNDFALATGTTLGLQTNWEEDQRAQKPEAFFGGPSYIYYPSNLTTIAYYTFSSYTVTDLQEIKALVARSRSKAVGAQGGLHVAIDSSVDLFGSYGFGNTRDEHSAQFARPIQACLPYYRQMLTSFQILP